MARKKGKAVKRAIRKKSSQELFGKHPNLRWLLPLLALVSFLFLLVNQQG